MGIKDLLGDFENIGVKKDDEQGSALAKKGRKRGRYKPPPSSARWSDLYSTCRGAILGSVQAAIDVIGTIERGEILHVISEGNWAMEHPIAHVATQFGPVDLWMATWAVNDDAVLRLSESVRQGFVRNCRAVVDLRMQVLRPAALDILQTAIGHGNLGMMQCHAKVYCLRQVDGDKCCAIVSSANFTQNPRPEAMIFQADMRAVEFYAGWIDKQLDEGSAKKYKHTGKLKEELLSEKDSWNNGPGDDKNTYRCASDYTPEKRRDTPLMVIFRGSSGSGKSTLARSTGFNVCSADDYHIDKSGQYRYNKKRADEAHDLCFKKATDAVLAGRDVAIDNTNLRVTEIAPYVMLARAHMYDIEIVLSYCSPAVAATRNKHGLDEKKVNQQVKSTEKVPSYWPKEKVVLTHG